MVGVFQFADFCHGITPFFFVATGGPHLVSMYSQRCDKRQLIYGMMCIVAKHRRLEGVEVETLCRGIQCENQPPILSVSFLSMLKLVPITCPRDIIPVAVKSEPI